MIFLRFRGLTCVFVFAAAAEVSETEEQIQDEPTGNLHAHHGWLTTD